MLKFSYLFFILMSSLQLNAVIYYQYAPYQTTPYDQARGYPSESLLLPNQSPEDKEITRRIEMDLRADSTIGPFADMIQVQTLGGEVVLTGRLESDRIRLNAERKVKNVRGVKKVYNNIELYQTK